MTPIKKWCVCWDGTFSGSLSALYRNVLRVAVTQTSCGLRRAASGHSPVTLCSACSTETDHNVSLLQMDFISSAEMFVLGRSRYFIINCIMKNKWSLAYADSPNTIHKHL